MRELNLGCPLCQCRCCREPEYQLPCEMGSGCMRPWLWVREDTNHPKIHPSYSLLGAAAVPARLWGSEPHNLFPEAAKFIFLDFTYPPAPVKNCPLEAGISVRADGCDSNHRWPISSFHSAPEKWAWLIHPLRRSAPGVLWHLLSPSSPLKLMSRSSDRFLSCLNHLRLCYMAPAFDIRLSSLLSNSHIPPINNTE